MEWKSQKTVKHSKWSMTKDVIEKVSSFEPSDCVTVKKLIESHCFEYILPAIYSQNPIEKFFWASKTAGRR